jgi:hypothetical protein
MKSFTPVIVLAAIILLCSLFSSCGKSTPDVNKPIEYTEGKWSVNRIELRIYYGTVLNKDSVIPRHPQGENFVSLDANKTFQFRFNSYTTDTGTYTYATGDSIIAVTSATTYRWKMLTLTNDLFTAKSTSTTDSSFPGATVETYYTFVR